MKFLHLHSTKLFLSRNSLGNIQISGKLIPIPHKRYLNKKEIHGFVHKRDGIAFNRSIFIF